MYGDVGGPLHGFHHWYPLRVGKVDGFLEAVDRWIRIPLKVGLGNSAAFSERVE